MRHCFEYTLDSTFYEVSCGLRGLRETLGLVEALVLDAGGGEVDPDESNGGLRASFGQQDSREGVAAQVWVAVLCQPGGDFGYLRADPGDLQWHVRRRRERSANVTVLSLRLDDASVGCGVGLGEWRDLLA